MAEKFDPGHADRLENPQRLVELPPENVVALLDLRGDETVVDYGAGTGMYTVPIAAALPRGPRPGRRRARGAPRRTSTPSSPPRGCRRTG